MPWGKQDEVEEDGEDEAAEQWGQPPGPIRAIDPKPEGPTKPMEEKYTI